MTEWLIGVVGALVVGIFIFIKGRLSGSATERSANQAKEAAANEKLLKDVSDATAARNAVRDDIVPDDDKYRRD